MDFSLHRLKMKNEKSKIENLEKRAFGFSRSGFRFLFFLSLAVCFLPLSARAQNQFENKQINDVEIAFTGTDSDASAAEQFRLIARTALGDDYSTVKVRDAIAALYRTDKIVSTSVAASEVGQNSVNVRFLIKRKTKAEKVNINVGNTVGDKVTEQELLLKLNLLNPGTSITEQTLRDNADVILAYLRQRGFYKAEVKFSQQPIKSETEVTVTFDVTPNAQAKIEKFNIAIAGFNPAKVRPKLELQPGEFYSRELLNEDVARIRQALREEKYIAPELDEPRIVYDFEKNSVSVELKGEVGAIVNIEVDAGREKISDKKLTELLTVKREGTLDYAAIVEGSRRLRNYFQENGYFFADVNAVCSVKPDFTENEAGETTNETDVLCGALTGATLKDRVVDIKYNVDLNRRLKLVDIRVQGTDKFTAEDIKGILGSQEANILGFIPFFGYGRGYTSSETLEEDRLAVQSVLRELGYRRAEVSVRQGVALNGEDLIITFVVSEGIPTKVESVEIDGNTSYSDAELFAKLPDLQGENFSRVRARNGVKEISQFYSENGYYDAKVNYSVVELPNEENQTKDQVKLVYTVENEGKKVFVNRILINGNDMTKREAVLKAVNVKPDQVLRTTDIFASEQNLYATDAFSLVEVKPEPAGETTDGTARLSDIIINLEEQKPRLITYGGGYSTDIGANGFFDIRHFNLFGKLQQGGARVRISRLQQLVQIDYVNPRFMPDGKNRFSPLTITAAYQRDSTVTRFFRSTFDQGTGGIVQRVDEKGNPIDQFGNSTGDPTINRLTFSAETSRTLSIKKKSFLFANYRFEDVRLKNFESLLVKDLLRPDSRVRLSGFGANFVYDTRENCNIKYTFLELIQKGTSGDPCRYSASDPTTGNYITAEYKISAPFLGANTGIHKFQAQYNRYFTISRLKNTTLAGRAILGLATVFSRNQNFNSTQFPDLNDSLPISERFFAGGSTTLRGFEFEGAGPRVAIVPQGTFLNSNGDQVYLSPFTVPFGGNALAIVNLEARIPVTELVRVVPFYDGGNVFRRVSDIFKPQRDIPADDVFRQNLRAIWSNTVGLGLRIKTPIGGEFAVDYGYLLNPPKFLIPQTDGTNAFYILKQGQIHFRFSQAF